MQKYTKYKKQFEKYQQTMKSSEKLNRKSLEDNLIDKIEIECFCNFFTKYLDETKNDVFLRI